VLVLVATLAESASEGGSISRVDDEPAKANGSGSINRATNSIGRIAKRADRIPRRESVITVSDEAVTGIFFRLRKTSGGELTNGIDVCKQHRVKVR
jgi:hypothetical protein